jgi:hypothetical protein
MRALALVGLPLLVASTARADSGMTFLQQSLGYLFLIGAAVIWLEAGVIRRGLQLTFRRTLGWVALANLASYVAGLPVLWFIRHHEPLFDAINHHESLPLSLGLFLFLFALSLAVEAPVLKIALRAPWWPVLKASILANILSYVLMIPFLGPLSYLPSEGMRKLYQFPVESQFMRLQDLARGHENDWTNPEAGGPGGALEVRAEGSHRATGVMSEPQQTEPERQAEHHGHHQCDQVVVARAESIGLGPGTHATSLARPPHGRNRPTDPGQAPTRQVPGTLRGGARLHLLRGDQALASRFAEVGLGLVDGMRGAGLVPYLERVGRGDRNFAETEEDRQRALHEQAELEKKRTSPWACRLPKSGRRA